MTMLYCSIFRMSLAVISVLKDDVLHTENIEQPLKEQSPLPGRDRGWLLHSASVVADALARSRSGGSY